MVAAVIALILVGIVFWLISTRFAVASNVRTITNVVLALIGVGIVLWLINTYIPMATSIKTILNIVVVIATCIGVLQAVGIWSGIVELWSNLIHGRRFNP